MRITLNLASKPHVDLSTYIKRLRIWILVLAILVAPLFALWRVESIRAATARAEEDQLQASSARLRAEQARSQAQMKEPANAAVLNESHFLNALFRDKSFSWTAVMMDLEMVLPAGVQVTSLEPAVQKDGSVLIRLRVSGPRDRSVQLIRNLEHAKRFVAPRLSGEAAENGQGTQAQAALAPVSASSSVSFEIIAGYNPLAPPAVTAKVETDEESEKPAESTDAKPVLHKVAVPEHAVIKPVPHKPSPIKPLGTPPAGGKR